MPSEVVVIYHIKNNMRLYSKKNISDELIDIFEINLCLPIIKGSDKPNQLIVDEIHPAKGFEIKFDTRLIYKKDNTWTYFQFTILGFGFSINKQKGY